jgi:hypothetical protein
VEASVDHLHPCIPKSLGDYLRASIVTVQPGLRNQNTNFPQIAPPPACFVDLLSGFSPFVNKKI